jgi:hydrophobe/amphiphile efflux-1 (HAE1) family protein
MSLSEISIKNPVFAWMMMLALMLFGFLCFRLLGVSQLPDVDFPVVNVSLYYEGASPQVMEQDVVQLVEGAMMGVEGVLKVYSSCRRNRGNVTVEFDIDKNIDVAVTDIQNKINQIRRRLPQEMEEITVSKSNPEDRPIIWMGTSSNKMSLPILMDYVRENMRDFFQTIPGVSEILLSGFVDPNVRVWVSPRALSRYELAIDDLMNTFTREHVELPAGVWREGPLEYSVRSLGEVSDLKSMEELPIPRQGAGGTKPILLKDVSVIEEGLNDIERISRVQGESAVGLGVRKQRGANSVGIGDLVKKKIEEIKKILPAGMKIGVNFDSTTFISESVHELLFTMLLACILTSVVCFLFLGSFSATFNVIFAIPTSLLGTFIVLKMFGFTLNTFTLLALSLSIGIVVDDAIMVLENIYRHKEMGKSSWQAAMDGAKEISFAAFAATAAIVAIFLPVAFMDGIIGKYFFQFGVTLSVAVMLSLLEALTLTPMRCSQMKMSQFSQHAQSHSEKETALQRFLGTGTRVFDKMEIFYKKILKGTLDHPGKILLISTILCGASFYLFKVLPKEFTPPTDTSSVFVRIKTKEGKSLLFTDEKMKEVEAYFLKRPEIKRFFVAVGGFGGDDPNSGNMFISLYSKLGDVVVPEAGADPKAPPVKTPPRASQQELIEMYRNDLKVIKDVKITISDPSVGSIGGGGGRGFPVEMTLQGPEWDKLILYSEKLMEKMEQTAEMVDVNSDFRGNIPEVQVVPKREALIQYGVSMSAVAQTIQALVGGVVVGQYTKNGRRWDIRLKLDPNQMKDWKELKNLSISNNRGEIVKLGNVVEIILGEGPVVITRLNRARSVSLNANLRPGASQQLAQEKIHQLAQEILPKDGGYQVIESGSSEAFNEAFKSLFFALFLGIIVSYMILAGQFNSLIDPLTILLALPFSLSGALLALYFFGQSLNIYSLIGFILLMGIVKKNSIILVDFAKQYRRQEQDKDKGGFIPSALESMLETAPKRLRPIVMTSLSTCVGALPAALSIGPGSEGVKPMALGVLGGVGVSTLLTLIVIPAFYVWADQLIKKFKSAK